MKFDIHADIRQASTPPAGFYTDPAMHARLRDRIFARSWQFIGDTDVVRIPGQVHPFTLLDGCIDEPLVLTRDTDDRLHCISNVCTHRGTLVCEHAGNHRFLRCRYHGRRFGLDGRFQHMPEFEQTANFPTPADNLAATPFGALSQWLFASLAPMCSFDEWIAAVVERIGWLPLHEFKLDASRGREYLVRANWALYCENYLEGFHIPFIHASLNEALDYGAYRTELFRWSSLQVGVAKGAEHCFDLPATSPDRGQRIAAYYFWLFPNLMLNFYPWGLSINVVRPIGHEMTKVRFVSYVWDAAKISAGAGAELDRVEREDESVVECVQRGLRSRIYQRGRYSPTREQGTHHFHRLLAEALG